MSRIISAARVATLVEGFDRSPAYAGLARSLRLLIADGRIAHAVRLPSERDLTAALQVSRTTVARAYADLRDEGYAEAVRGSGTFTRVPGGPTRSPDRALTPRVGSDRDDFIDLNCAAASAPVGVRAAYDAAVAELPAYLSGHGYYPGGLPELRAAIAATYDDRGLPTTPDQIMVVPGALAGTSIVGQALLQPGDRAIVESPVYPNAVQALIHSGARVISTPVEADGWDLAGAEIELRRSAPRLAYLIPDFQNPTGHLMSDADRARLGALLARSGTVALVDESHQGLQLDGLEMPRPLAAHVEAAGGEAITLGSASKLVWGGLRLGWIRAPRRVMDDLTEARLRLDLGSPVLEQLALGHLLRDPEPTLAEQRTAVRARRDALVSALAERLPTWRFRVPSGGMHLWCELPVPLGSRLAMEAERVGVSITPGPVFAVGGGFDRFVRLPWARPVEDLVEAVGRLAGAWEATLEQPSGQGLGGARRTRVLVA